MDFFFYFGCVCAVICLIQIAFYAVSFILYLTVGHKYKNLTSFVNNIFWWW